MSAQKAANPNKMPKWLFKLTCEVISPALMAVFALVFAAPKPKSIKSLKANGTSNNAPEAKHNNKNANADCFL